MCDQVGIVERGQLLATGSVAEIQRRLQGSTWVQLVAIRQGEALEAWLAGKSNVSQIARNENKLSFQFDGGSEDQAELLKAIVNEDFLISEFAARQETLEDVFMKITTGAVQ